MGAAEAEPSMGRVGVVRALQGSSGLGKGQEMFGYQWKMREQRKEFP